MSDEIRKVLLELQDPFLEFGKLEHDYINRYIEAADRKAGVSFAATTAVLVYFIDNDNGLRWLDFSHFEASNLFAFVTVVLLLLSSAQAFGVVLPRLSGNPQGLIFWQAVAERPSATAYATEILARTPDELREARISHCHELAKVCTRKFRILNSAMSWGVVGIVMFLVTKGLDTLILSGK